MNNNIGNRFSNIGFILAASGSAVGLGNIWKFPYMAGENGGGVFVLVYLFCIIFIGFSIFVGELIIGRRGRSNTFDNFESLANTKNKKIWKIGGLSIFTGFFIFGYYTVVISWIMYYIGILILGQFPEDVNSAKELFGNIVAHKHLTILIIELFQVILLGIVMSAGVKKGIERVNKIFIPLLIVILLGIFLYSMTLDGFSKAVNFLFSFKPENFNKDSLLESIGHSFLTLSVGTSAIIAYATSMDSKASIAKSAFAVVVMDTFIAIIAGIGIFSIIFTAGENPNGGPGLVFITFPTILSQFGLFGSIINIVFFIVLFFAGFSSALSLIEPSVEYLQSKDVNRIKAIVILLAIAFTISCVVIYNEKVFDILDYITTNITIPIMGLFGAIFLAYFVDQNILKEEIGSSGLLYKTWLFSIRYLVPISLVVVIVNIVIL